MVSFLNNTDRQESYSRLSLLNLASALLLSLLLFSFFKGINYFSKPETLEFYLSIGSLPAIFFIIAGLTKTQKNKKENLILVGGAFPIVGMLIWITIQIYNL